jgi:hypothetical protein
LGRGGGSPASIADIFNLFQPIAGRTYTGGALVVPDSTGALVTSPANTAALTGGRFAAGVWYPTDAEGAYLGTYASLRTKAGTKLWPLAPFAVKGYENWPARTNLALWSEGFDNAAWVKTSTTVTPNAATSPNGETTADNFTHTGADGLISQNITVSSGAVVTATLRAKYVDNPWIKLLILGTISSDGVVAFFNIQTGAIGTTSTLGAGTNLSATLKPINNGFYEISITGSIPGVTTYRIWWYQTTVDNTIIRATGTTMTIWGAQPEAGAFLSPYIKTEGLTVTRAATNLSIPSAGFIRANDWGARLTIIPAAAGQTGWAMNSYTDATAETGVLVAPTAVTFRKRVASTDVDVSVSYTHVAGREFQVDIAKTTAGMSARTRELVAGVWSAWSAWTDNTAAGALTDATIAATVGVGHRNSAAHLAGNITGILPVFSGSAKTVLEGIA